MKKIISMIVALSTILTVGVNAYACEEVLTPANEVYPTVGFSTGTVTIGGKTLTFPGNSLQKSNYTEILHNTCFTGNYEKIRFYLQTTSNTSDVTPELRMIYNHYPDGNLQNQHNGSAQVQDRKHPEAGDDAILCEYDLFKMVDSEKVYHNNIKFCFGPGTPVGAVTMTAADINFISYNPAAPKASIGENDVTSGVGGVVSAIEVEFSQKMNAATALPAEFSLEEADGTPVANVAQVNFDSEFKTATLVFDSLVPFDTDYTLKISENVKNDCEVCDFAVDETTREHTVSFDEPAPIMIGEGKFYKGSDVITELPASGMAYIDYKVNVKNKYDLTPGGKTFTLMLVWYKEGKLKGVDYDTCTLAPGQDDELNARFVWRTSMADDVSAFLLDNPEDMNAMADMAKISAPAATE